MALKAYNTKLELGSTADYTGVNTWTIIAAVERVKAGGVSAEMADVTHLASPNELREKLPTLGEGQPFEATIQYDKAIAASLFAVWRVIRAWRVRYVDDSGWKFNGAISELGDEEVVNGEIVRQTVTITPTGAIVYDDTILT